MMVLKKDEINSTRKLSIPAIVGITLCAVFLLVFISYHGYMAVMGNELKTEIAFADDSAKTLDVDMFVVRDEKVISASGGNVVSAVKDGTRVSVNDTVAYSFYDSESAGNIIRMNEINELLDYYSALTNASTNVVSDTTAYDNRIMSDLYSFAAMVSSGDFSSLDEKQQEIRDAITSKQTATGVDIDVSQAVSALKSEYSVLASGTSNYSEIKAGSTGYYISGADGYENKLDYSKVDEWTIDAVENALDSTPDAISASAAGRLVHGYYWYLACVTETSGINELKEGSRYTVSFPDSSVDDVTAQIYSISSDRETGKSLIVFRCNKMSEELASLRCESAVINVVEYDGLRVNNDAIRSNEDNETGVYVVKGGYMYFRKVIIIYSTDEYSIVADPTDNGVLPDGEKASQYLGLYDEYITYGRNLSHGRLIQQ